MKHPNPDKQKSQDEFLKKCTNEEREFHARLFRIGNTLYAYHQNTAAVKDKDLLFYYKEWLQGLPPHISEDMKKQGFDNCKTMLPFTRYVNERLDYGLTDWMEDHLSEEDFKYYQSQDKPQENK